METGPMEGSEGGQPELLAQRVLALAAEVLKAFYRCKRCDEFAVEFEVLLPEVSKPRRGIFGRRHVEQPRLKTMAWRTEQAIQFDDGRKVRLFLTYGGTLCMRVESHLIHGHSLPLQLQLDEATLSAMDERSLHMILNTLDMQRSFLALLDENILPEDEEDETPQHPN